MTQKVVSTHLDTPLIEAANVILKYNFNGLPVVDANNFLVGILTEYDLVIKGSAIHLPTFIKLLGQFDLYRKDKHLITNDLKKIFEMKVKDVMNREPLVLLENASIEETLKAFSEHHRVNPIPVINNEKKIVGIVSRYDLNKLFGSAGLYLEDQSQEREIDRNVNTFISNFERQFIFVSKFRTHFWLLASILFALVGYLIAWFLILRIDL